MVIKICLWHHIKLDTIASCLIFLRISYLSSCEGEKKKRFYETCKLFYTYNFQYSWLKLLAGIIDA